MDEHRPEEARLLLDYWQSRSIEDRNRAAEAFLRYPAMIARRFSGKGVEYEELRQVASLALLRAVERFDPTRGARFLTFAVPTMVGEVKNYFRDRAGLIRTPRGGATLLREIEKTRAILEQELLRSPTLDEIAARADLPLESVVEAMAIANSRSVASLDADTSDKEDGTLADLFGQDEQGFERFETHEAIRTAISGLDTLEQTCVRLRFFENKNQRETAREMGVSQMTISRMERRILQKLRRIMEED